MADKNPQSDGTQSDGTQSDGTHSDGTQSDGTQSDGTQSDGTQLDDTGRDDTEAPPPLEDGDFYFNDDRLMVMTRQYHLKRGYCCKSGCLHCPWNYRLRKREP